MRQKNNEKTQQEINRAINFLGQNKFSEAEVVCNEILRQKANADAFHILSSIKIYKKEFQESIELVKKSIKINPENPGYHVTLGCAYSASKDYESSVGAFKQAIKLNDQIAQVYFYLGESYRKLEKYNDAISSLYKTIELSPDHVGAYMILGIVYQEKKQFDLSIKSFSKCIEIMPDYAEAHINLGLCYLLIGDYENGWREYEWRRKIITLSSDKLKKEWTGQSLEGKDLLIIDEGANSNTINFVRFAKELKKDNCKIILQCNDQTISLFESQTWVDQVVLNDNFPDHDYYIYVGSFMNVLKFNPKESFYDTPYLSVTKNDFEYINDEKYNIGLLLEADKNSNAFSDESIDPSLFNDVFSDCHNIICLDEDVDINQTHNLYNHKSTFNNLDELAKILVNLDLVITVDHIVAHIAGALNIKTFLMLPTVPNWRWDLNYRTTSPWYKSFIIFRQDIPNEWQSVINKVKSKLHENYHD